MGRRRPTSSSRRLTGATLIGVLGLVGGGSAFFVGGRSGLLASSWSTIREWGQAKVGGDTTSVAARESGGGGATASLFSSVVASVKVCGYVQCTRFAAFFGELVEEEG